jgi:hypothetical protein
METMTSVPAGRGTAPHWYELPEIVSPRSRLHSSSVRSGSFQRGEDGIHSVTAGVVGGNDNNIVRAGSLVPVEGGGLALQSRGDIMSNLEQESGVVEKIANLGENGSVDRKVSPDTEDGEGENESNGEKSGVHRRNTFQTLITREGKGKGWILLLVKHGICTEGRRKTEGGPSNCSSSVLGGSGISFPTITGSDLFIWE